MAAMLDALKSDNFFRSIQSQVGVAVDTLANIANCNPIECRSAGQGGINVPAGQTYITLTFYVSYDGTTYVQLFDAANVAISRTVAAGRAYPLPPELFNFTYFKIVVAANAGVIGVSLKS